MKTILTIFILFTAGISFSSNAQLPYEFVSARDATLAPLTESDSLYRDFFHGQMLMTQEGSFYYKDINSNSASYISLFKYDIEQKTHTQLLRNGRYAEDDQLMSNNSETKVFLKIGGKLFVTDGTQQGTLELADSGTYFCCGSYGGDVSAMHLITVLDDILYFQIGANFSDNNVPDEYQLWQSDGTPQGTKIVPNVLTQYRITFIANQIGSSKGAILFDTDPLTPKLWSSDKQQEPELLYSFPDGVAIFSDVIIHNSNGIFFCSYDGGQLWKIANDATVSVLAEDCKELVKSRDASYPNGGFYYMSKDGGLWNIEGAFGSKKLIYSVNSDSAYSSNICNVADKSYLSITVRTDEFGYTYDSSLVEISANMNAKDITPSLKLGPDPEEIRIVACSDDGMVIGDGSNPDDSSPYDSIFFDSYQGTSHRIINFEKDDGYGFDHNLNSNQAATKKINAKAIFITSYSHFFYLQPNYAFQIPALDILMQDEIQAE